MRRSQMSIIEQLSKNRNEVGYQLYQLLFIKQPYIYEWIYNQGQFIPKKKYCDRAKMKDFFIRQFHEYENAINSIWNIYEGQQVRESITNYTFCSNNQIFYYDNKLGLWMRVY